MVQNTSHTGLQGQSCKIVPWVYNTYQPHPCPWFVPLKCVNVLQGTFEFSNVFEFEIDVISGRRETERRQLGRQ
jgi:hypothetical protein